VKITHNMSSGPTYRRSLRVLLIGSGGNGSAVLFGLPYLHQALIAWGQYSGLDVTVMDGDTVSPTNCVRQPFGVADIGLNKATVLVNRANLFHGLDWKARTEFFTKDAKDTDVNSDSIIDLIISCVDTRAARREMHEAFNTRSGPWRMVRYWLDLGNNASNGQFVLGQPLNDTNRRTKERLRTVTELFPSIMDTSKGSHYSRVVQPPKLWNDRSPLSTMCWLRVRLRWSLASCVTALSIIMERSTTPQLVVPCRCRLIRRCGLSKIASGGGLVHLPHSVLSGSPAMGPLPRPQRRLLRNSSLKRQSTSIPT